MAQPFGRWLVAGVGVAVIAAGLAHFAKAWREGYRRHLKADRHTMRATAVAGGRSVSNSESSTRLPPTVIKVKTSDGGYLITLRNSIHEASRGARRLPNPAGGAQQKTGRERRETDPRQGPEAGPSIRDQPSAEQYAKRGDAEPRHERVLGPDAVTPA